MIIIGAKGHARDLLDVLKDDYSEVNFRFFDDVSNDLDSEFHGYEVIKSLDEVKRIFKRDTCFSLAIGNPKARQKLAEKFISLGGHFQSISSLKALVSNITSIGDGINVMPFASLFPTSSIGNGVLVNSFASVHHDAIIGDFTVISPGARILGNCKIGKRVLVGANSTILPGIKITSDVTIGAGSVVTNDILIPGTYVGVPSKKITNE